MDTPELRQAFALIDSDRDGNITSEELIKVIDKVGGCMTEDEARALIRKADSDKNGSVDFTEFQNLWASLKGGDDEDIKEEFLKYDVDGNGFITKDEMLKAVSIMSKDQKAEAEKFVSQLDVDKDGKVSYPEWLLIWRYRALGKLYLP